MGSGVGLLDVRVLEAAIDRPFDEHVGDPRNLPEKAVFEGRFFDPFTDSVS